MIRYIGYVESIDWEDNTCRVRIPNIDGLGKSFRVMSKAVLPLTLISAKAAFSGGVASAIMVSDILKLSIFFRNNIGFAVLF